MRQRRASTERRRFGVPRFQSLGYTFGRWLHENVCDDVSEDISPFSASFARTKRSSLVPLSAEAPRAKADALCDATVSTRGLGAPAAIHCSKSAMTGVRPTGLRRRSSWSAKKHYSGSDEHERILPTHQRIARNV